MVTEELKWNTMDIVMEQPKKYEELNFTDDFMFCKVLTHNLELCRELLEIILDQKIRKVELPEAQKSIKITYDGKGVRLDVYVEDEENTVYDLEMQATDTKNLPKRSRYYQGMIDLNLISKGENYKKLKKSFVIFICKFDPFDKGLCKYTFKNLCVEQTEIELQDEAVKIFINPYGKSEDMSEELRDFLKYLCGEESESDFTKKLDEEVHKAREQKEWRVEYMTLLMRDQENIEKGIERGRELGRTEGRMEGRMETLVALVKENVISLEVAAQQAEMTVEEFETLLSRDE